MEPVWDFTLETTDGENFTLSDKSEFFGTSNIFSELQFWVFIDSEKMIIKRIIRMIGEEPNFEKDFGDKYLYTLLSLNGIFVFHFFDMDIKTF